MNTKDIGILSECKIIAELVQIGIVSTPIGDNARYDLILDQDGKLKRIQCKTGRVKNGVVKFNTANVLYGGKNKSYQKDIDCFAVYVPELDKCYLVPIEMATESEMSLRIEPTKNGQTVGINWANDFILLV